MDKCTPGRTGGPDPGPRAPSVSVEALALATVAFAQPVELRGQPRTGSALAALDFDACLNRFERLDQAGDVGLPPSRLALVGPAAEGGVLAFVVAAFAGKHQILVPGRAALDPGDHVLDARAYEALTGVALTPGASMRFCARPSGIADTA